MPMTFIRKRPCRERDVCPKTILQAICSISFNQDLTKVTVFGRQSDKNCHFALGSVQRKFTQLT